MTKKYIEDPGSYKLKKQNEEKTQKKKKEEEDLVQSYVRMPSNYFLAGEFIVSLQSLMSHLNVIKCQEQRSIMVYMALMFSTSNATRGLCPYDYVCM